MYYVEYTYLFMNLKNNMIYDLLRLEKIIIIGEPKLLIGDPPDFYRRPQTFHRRPQTFL